MKFTTLFLLATFMACLPTCKKNSPPFVDVPVDPPIDTIVTPPIDTHIIALGKVFVLKNGLPWDVPFIAGFHNIPGTFFITGRQVYTNGVDESFTIRDIPCLPGKFSLEFWPSQASLYPNKIPNGSLGMLFEGDQPIGSFFMDSTRTDHFIEVLSYDTLTNIVEGRFQMFMNKELPVGFDFPGVPNTIDMTEGRFRLEVK